MADLLECLIQIKALGEALALAETGAPSMSENEPASMQRVPVWQLMYEAERRYAEALGAETGVRAEMPASELGTAAARDEFAGRRRANLAMLSNCSAAKLGGTVEWPGRPATTLADLVAIMLASDTEVLGELRRARSTPESPVPLLDVARGGPELVEGPSPEPRNPT
jgi:hypothetical protein